MYGRIVVSERPGLLPRRARYTTERIYGVTFLKTEVFLPETERKSACRRALERVARGMKNQGFSYTVTPPDFPFDPVLLQCGLSRISTVGLCRAMAVPMTFLALKEEGIDPKKATVGLVASRVTPMIEQIAVRLSMRVRHLALEIPSGGSALCRYLRREYGVPAMDGLMGLQSGDATVVFSPGRQDFLQGYGPVLYLSDQEPSLHYQGRVITNARFTLREGKTLPPGSDQTQLLAALYDCRAVNPEEIEILNLS